MPVGAYDYFGWLGANQSAETKVGEWYAQEVLNRNQNDDFDEDDDDFDEYLRRIQQRCAELSPATTIPSRDTKSSSRPGSVSH